MSRSTLEPSDVALVALPWYRRDRPSMALSTLATHLRRARPHARTRVVHAYMAAASDVGFALYDGLAEYADREGELLYAAVYYPERTDAVVDYCARQREGRCRGDAVAWARDDLVRVVAALRTQVEQLADELAATARLVGMTSVYGGLFGALALARALKARRADVVTVVGGHSVAGPAGPSVLQVYPEVDLAVQGEGERAIVRLFDLLDRGECLAVRASGGRTSTAAPLAAVDGIVARLPLPTTSDAASDGGRPDSLDDLPIPDHDEYAALADAQGLDWDLPIEGSRGCWWDRTRNTGDARDKCYFCSIHGREDLAYREKSVARVLDEVRTLVERHERTRVYFTDEILRHRGAVELAAGLRDSGRHLTLFHQMRASVAPLELLTWWEAGLRTVQVGIESLSQAMLDRANKGTLVIQNLATMRLLHELGVANASNVLLDFPGVTQTELGENVEVIERFARSFEPLTLSTFGLHQGTTVERLPERFGVRNVRNRGAYAHAVPPRDLARLVLFQQDFDTDPAGVDFEPLRRTFDAWRAAWHPARRLLTYADGVTFLNVTDERDGKLSTGSFRGLEREVYLACLEVRTLGELARRFDGRATADAIEAAVARFVDWNVMFRQGDRCLSLAVATAPHLAATRIRAAAAHDPRRVRLALAR